MATIDATVGGVSANSYITEAEGDTYWDANYYNTTWTALSSANKQTLSIMATRLLDYWVDWIGSKATSTQALRWPRYDVTDRDGYWVDGNVIPTFLKNASAELAGHLASYNPSSEPDTKGFSELRVGELMLKIDKDDRDSVTTIPDSVIAIIEGYGSLRSRNAGGVVKLKRA